MKGHNQSFVRRVATQWLSGCHVSLAMCRVCGTVRARGATGFDQSHRTSEDE